MLTLAPSCAFTVTSKSGQEVSIYRTRDGAASRPAPYWLTTDVHGREEYEFNILKLHELTVQLPPEKRYGERPDQALLQYAIDIGYVGFEDGMLAMQRFTAKKFMYVSIVRNVVDDVTGPLSRGAEVVVKVLYDTSPDDPHGPAESIDIQWAHWGDGSKDRTSLTPEEEEEVSEQVDWELQTLQSELAEELPGRRT